VSFTYPNQPSKAKLETGAKNFDIVSEGPKAFSFRELLSSHPAVKALETQTRVMRQECAGVESREI